MIARTLVPVTLIRGVLYTATAYEDETTYGIATITHMIQRNPAFGRKEKKKKIILDINVKCSLSLTRPAYFKSDHGSEQNFVNHGKSKPSFM